MKFGLSKLAAAAALILAPLSAGAVTVISGTVGSPNILDENLASVADPGAGTLSLAGIGSAFLITTAANGSNGPNNVELQQTFVNNSTSDWLVSAFIELPDGNMTNEFLTASVLSPAAVYNLGTDAARDGFLVDSGSTVTLNWGGHVTDTVGIVAFIGVSQVPLPAAGGMLLTAVVAGGIAARRKKKAA